MSNQIPLNTTTGAAGGVLVPDVLSDEIIVQKKQQAAGELILSSRQIVTGRDYTIPIMNGQPEAFNVDELEDIPDDGAEFKDVSLNLTKQAVIIPASYELLAFAIGNPQALFTDAAYKAILLRQGGNVLGAYKNGGATTSPYNSNLIDDAGDSVVLGSDGDKIKKSVSAAMGVIEGNGYTPTGVLLGGDSAQLIRDARTENDNTVDVYGSSNDPFYGLDAAISTNLNRISDADEDDVVGVVADWSQCQYKLHSDVRVQITDTAEDSFRKDKAKVKVVSFGGFVITDPRAVVTITKGEAGS